MKNSFLFIAALLTCVSASVLADASYTLFDGSGLTGWTSNEETAGAFSVEPDGSLKVHNGRAHLFWTGTESIPASFTDFALKARVKTTPGANSGIFFHTQYQEKGWPAHGYEAQVNSTHKDRRKTGSIYAVSDVLDEAPSTDGEWFDYEIRVEGRTVTVKVDGKVVNEYTEPVDLPKEGASEKRRLSAGTFALQGHDPKSIVYYRDITVQPL